jgi:hypothetical protein
MPKKDEINLTAMVIMENHEPYLHALIPNLQRMCDRIVLKDNGSTDKSVAVASGLLRPNDVLLMKQQGEDQYLGMVLNSVLQHIAEDDWVILMEPYELPSMAMLHLKEYLRKYAQHSRYFTIVYRLADRKSGDPYKECRVFCKSKTVISPWGNIVGHGEIGTIPTSIGMAILNFETYGLNDTNALILPRIPANVDFDAPMGWLERISKHESKSSLPSTPAP